MAPVESESPEWLTASSRALARSGAAIAAHTAIASASSAVQPPPRVASRAASSRAPAGPR
jgi:hypothetical protein